MKPNDTPNKCPHCGDRLRAAARGTAQVARCRRCGFVYPRPRRRLDDAACRDHDVVPVDRYRLLTPLSRTGPGRVYLARHLTLDEPCVVKILGTDDPRYSADACRQFVEEAKAGFRIQHPNVARVIDCGNTGEQWYYVMAYVEGESLADLLRGCGRMPWPQVAELGTQIAGGLTAIHRVGLLHRDIKPANLILGADGSVKIADLGLISLIDRSGEKRHHGFGVGTPHYMAPEQRAGAEANASSDIYALGATLYHMLTGRTLIRGGGGPLEYLTGGDSHAPLGWPTDISPAPPKWFTHLIDRCVSAEPGQRPLSTVDLSRDIERGLANQPKSLITTRSPQTATLRGAVVLPFANQSTHPDDDWLGHALADQIQHALISASAVQVIDRHEFLKLASLRGNPNIETLSATESIDIAECVGAATIVRGSVQRCSDRLHVTLRVTDTNSPKADRKSGATLQGDADDPIDLLSRVASRVVEMLGHRPFKDAANTTATMSAPVRRSYVAAQQAFAAGHYAACIDHAEKGLRGDPEAVELVSLTGVCHARLGHYDRAVQCHRTLERLSRDRKDVYRLVEATGNLGVMNFFKGEYALAYDLFQRAGELAEEHNLLPLLAKNFNNLGHVLTKMERLADADDAFEQAIRIKQSLGATASLISPFNGRGQIALHEGRQSDALQWFNRALQAARELGDPVAVGTCHTHLGRCHLAMQDLPEAEAHLTLASQTLAATEFWNGTTRAYEHLAELHLTQRNGQAALDCIEKRIDLARRHGNRRDEAAAWAQKARVYEMNTQTDRAMECLRKSIELQAIALN